ncbi:MAG TPA: TIGR04222 domain-containing membrane protein [Rhodocyclaceae bacterium]|nr:TIGR04222 domain-containing membrane protein [Rhodocyclaceae bacterium]
MSISGPAFLVLYSLLALAVVWLLRSHYGRRETEGQRVPQLQLSKDPYQVAMLRDGAKGAVQTAVVSLVDRGLLEELDGRVRLVDEKSLALELRPFENYVLAACRQWIEPAIIEQRPAVASACREYEADLGRRALLADARTFAGRLPAYLAAAGLTLGVAVARIAYALAHGRHNVIFLMILALVCAVFLHRAYRNRRTGLGDKALARLAILFARLKRDAKRIIPGGGNQDLALAVAVFGVAILPAETFPYLARLYPKPKSSGGNGGDSGSSSGGCGGGCGGCGG